MRKLPLSCLALSSLALAQISTGALVASYTWNGSSDGDWNNSLNWDGGLVAPSISDANTSNGVQDFSQITFIGPIMPTTNIPAHGGGFAQDTHSLILNSGGTFTLNLASALDGFINETAGRTMAIVGDGVGTAGTASGAELLVTNFTYLVRHSQSGQIVVNDDGVLTMDGNLAAFQGNRLINFVLEGGSMTTNGVVSNLDNGTTDPFSNTGTITFNQIGSSFTADFGQEFGDLTAVNDDVNGVFVTGSGISLQKVDNTDGTFTVTAIPEPSVFGLVGIGALALLRRRRNS